MTHPTTTSQGSDPDMDEALRRVRKQPLPLPRPTSRLGATDTKALLALEIDLVPTMGCGTCSGWGTILDHKTGHMKTCPTCGGKG